MKKTKASKLIIVLLFTAMIYTPLSAEDLSMDSPFGVLEFLHWNHDWNNYKYSSAEDLKKVVTLMKEAGVGWVRMDFLWEDIEPRQGEFQFTKYDYIVDLLTENKINILGLLNYSSPWASSCQKWNCPPKEVGLFVDYAVKVASRYKEKIKYWEIWNEPDSHIYWSEQDGLKSYSLLLKEVYSALKKLDPECKILNGGLANGPGSINRLYDNGAKDYFDILNIHIFYSPLHAGAIKRVSAYAQSAYKIMARNGDTHKKIWVTEIGCPGVKRFQKVKNWWQGRNPTERKQAGWVKLVYGALLKEKNVAKVFWAFFRDCQGHWDNGVDYFGLVRWNFSKKPAFSTYQEITHDWK